MMVYRPLQIIIPEETNGQSDLVRTLQTEFTEIEFVQVQRKYFSEEKGLAAVEKLCVPEFKSVQLDLQGKFYTLAAVGCLVKVII